VINKIVRNAAEALADVRDGSTVLVGGFGAVGQPDELVLALLEQGARDLVAVANGSGVGPASLAAMIEAGRVRKLICSFPRSPTPGGAFDQAMASGKLEVELVPQGTLAERIRAAAAGVGGFFTAVSAGTELATGKEVREIDGKVCVLETPIFADVALCKAFRGDRWGNLTYRRSGRNFNPVMAAAAKTTVAQVSEIVELGSLDPDHIVTPGIFVDRVVQIGETA
jgi:3-oxoadipate CoA-transferase alpha subunit